MTNRYPLWKNLLILIVVLCGFYYAAPNLYAPDPALQIAGASSAQQIDERVLARAMAALTEAGIAAKYWSQAQGSWELQAEKAARIA